MSFEQSRLRSDMIGTQVITRSTGRRLGVVSQLWVDIDRGRGEGGEVVALGLRDNILSKVVSGPEQIMLLSSIRQIGDVILVDDDSVIEDDISVANYTNLVKSEVITESGEGLGRVRGFKFDVVSGKLLSLVIASMGLPQIPDQVISSYELPVEEIVSTGPDRIIVFEGSEEKLKQISVGLLERLGLGSAPWEREDDGYIMPTSASNQLPSGLKQEAPAPRREAAPPQRLELEQPSRPPMEQAIPEEEPYQAQPLNIPQKKKVIEYEEEDF
ncbi:photosystem reaction center subunit H [Leptolyngbyaceae cyanobacterium CCMR0082]|uniref:Photosystem reaction center subunit H n=2 Tax=Adonisia turfae TaxID=2950184 RepID=A0A6M0S3U7_9CYAN|nr:PRC-barrel domain-containing protein [Adonisia turfae]MDV3347755.1 PRC-barrel domain-containing protein [Leptothoe sp. LEGE 181152]NEZ60506.1 photosystem reaction center subunit H [Adonisia turfae CCMR0081]NEZ62631.1 photosystem reaction center subunit H [Adonisia turfae CCMR0082]